MPDSFDFFGFLFTPADSSLQNWPRVLKKCLSPKILAQNKCIFHEASPPFIAMHSHHHHPCHHQASIVLVRRWAVEAFNKERWGRGGINFFEHTPATIPTTPTIHFALFTDVGITPELRTWTRPDFVNKAVRPTRRSWAQWISISSTCSCA